MSNDDQPAIPFSETLMIGDNDVGYKFGVGLAGDRWLGFALGDLPGGDKMLFVMPNVSEGFDLGLKDRDQAILMTGAIAQDPESAFGGITRWFVQADLRGDPNTIARCPRCGEIGCQDDHDDFESGFDSGNWLNEFDEGTRDGP